jgi:hypothetical protein
MALSRQYTLSLAAPSSTSVALSQTSLAGVSLLINGGLASNGVATFDNPRRVLVSPTGNESANTFTISGTDRYGIPQSEALAGLNATSSFTAHDFATVSSVIPINMPAAVLTVGTNGVGSTEPWVVDTWANPPSIGVFTTVSSAAVIYDVEVCGQDLSPAWNVNNNTPTYYPNENFAGIGYNARGFINEPITMIRGTILSGTGSVQFNFRQAYKAY